MQDIFCLVESVLINNLNPAKGSFLSAEKKQTCFINIRNLEHIEIEKIQNFLRSMNQISHMVEHQKSC